GGRRLTEPPFLPQAARNLQPHPIRHDRSIERPRKIADALEVLEQRAALRALIEVDLELRSTDRSQRAVDQLLNRVRVTLAVHFFMPRGPTPAATRRVASLAPGYRRQPAWGALRRARPRLLRASFPHRSRTSPRRPRRRIRALCTCDFDVPSALPRTSATS